MSELEKINREFNESLRKYKENRLEGNRIPLGYPMSKLLRAGIKKAFMFITKRTLTAKIGQHGELSLSLLTNLPKRLNAPIMVFRSLTVANAHVVLTEIKSAEGNLVVALHLKQQGQGLYLNEIASVHGRPSQQIINWLLSDEAPLVWADKKKAQRWLIGSGCNSRQSKQVMDLIANINDKNGLGNTLPEAKPDEINYWPGTSQLAFGLIPGIGSKKLFRVGVVRGGFLHYTGYDSPVKVPYTKETGFRLVDKEEIETIVHNKKIGSNDVYSRERFDEIKKVAERMAGFIMEIEARLALPMLYEEVRSTGLGGNKHLKGEQLDNIPELIEKAKLEKNRLYYVEMMPVTEHAKKILETYFDQSFDYYRHIMFTNEIRHTINEHGDPEKEAELGQIAVTWQDFELIPAIITNPDSISVSERRKHFTLEYKKMFDVLYTYQEEIRIGQKGVLALKTLWIKKTANNTIDGLDYPAFWWQNAPQLNGHTASEPIHEQRYPPTPTISTLQGNTAPKDYTALIPTPKQPINKNRPSGLDSLPLTGSPVASLQGGQSDNPVTSTKITQSKQLGNTHSIEDVMASTSYKSAFSSKLQKGRLVKFLSKKFWYNGKVMTKKEIIEEKLKPQGRKPKVLRVTDYKKIERLKREVESMKNRDGGFYVPYNEDHPIRKKYQSLLDQIDAKPQTNQYLIGDGKNDYLITQMEYDYAMMYFNSPFLHQTVDYPKFIAAVEKAIPILEAEFGEEEATAAAVSLLENETSASAKKEVTYQVQLAATILAYVKLGYFANYEEQAKEVLKGKNLLPVHALGFERQAISAGQNVAIAGKRKAALKIYKKLLEDNGFDASGVPLNGLGQPFGLFDDDYKFILNRYKK